ncbi:hypothetical protein AGMMS49992_10140 [Clostridia bacterium]|nr:hypothetical protein AGMMS49992_10140 [Clostridia bacterium]
MTTDNEVFRCTQALGEALADTDAYLFMREAEAAVRDNPEASEALTRLSAHKAALTSLMEDSDMDSEAVKLHTQMIYDLQASLGEMPLVERMQEARQAFTSLISQVNQVLAFMVADNVEDGTTAGYSSGCGGSCAGCSGCGGGGTYGDD